MKLPICVWSCEVFKKLEVKLSPVVCWVVLEMILRPEDSLADEFNIYVYNTNFATCAHNRLFSTLLIGTDGKYRQHCSINKVLMSIGHIISYMYFLFTICSATRISWQNERIDVAPNATTYYCTTSNGAHSKNEHH